MRKTCDENQRALPAGVKRQQSLLEEYGLDAHIPGGTGLPKVFTEDQGKGMDTFWHLIAPLPMSRAIGEHRAIWPGHTG